MSTFIYIQTVDCGLAPCVRDGIWTLAICKPGIRKHAQKGDIVIAVTEKADGHQLSSWSRIKERITTDEYFRGYSKSRPDNIYRMNPDGGYERIKKAGHFAHSSPKDLVHDTGKRGERAFVLISDDFYTFGKDRIPLDKWTSKLPELRRVIDGLARATRRYFDEDVEADIKQLERWLKKTHAARHNKSFEPREKLNTPSCESRTQDACYQRSPSPKCLKE